MSGGQAAPYRKGELLEARAVLAMGKRAWVAVEFSHYGCNGRHLYVRETSGRMAVCLAHQVRRPRGAR